jgi:hypothetical protein
VAYDAGSLLKAQSSKSISSATATSLLPAARLPVGVGVGVGVGLVRKKNEAMPTTAYWLGDRAPRGEVQARYKAAALGGGGGWRLRLL